MRPPFSVVIIPLALRVGTLKEYAVGGPTYGPMLNAPCEGTWEVFVASNRAS